MRPSADRLHENEKNILVDNVSRSYIKYDRFNYTQSEGHQIKQDDIFQINCRDLSIEDVFIFQLASIKKVRSDTVDPTADCDAARLREKNLHIWEFDLRRTSHSSSAANIKKSRVDWSGPASHWELEQIC